MNHTLIDQWMREAAAAYQRRDSARALDLLQRVLSRMPAFGPALQLTGLVYLAGGQSAQALPFLQRAVQAMPADLECLRALGVCQADMNQGDAAMQSFRTLIDRRPRDADALLNLALMLERNGDIDEAREFYTRILDVDPRHVEACARLGTIAEARNEFETAATWTARALECDPANVVANLTQAQLDSRTGRDAEAAERLEKLLGQSLAPINQAVAGARLGRALDRVGEHDKAFRACEASNRALAGIYGRVPEGSSPYSFATIALLKDYFSQAPAFDEYPVSPEDHARPPVFLVGFPRSGTTLLDRMLAAHPALGVLEEQDALGGIKSDFLGGRDALARLAALPAQAIGGYRESYRRRLASLTPDEHRGRIIVDKLPLNAILIGVIQRFFPEARFILALRDPRDVALSCFMQSFGLDEAMRYMLDLATIGDYYAAVLNLVAVYRDATPPPRLFAVRYEDVVRDMRQTLGGLLDFLELPWDDAVLDYRGKLRGQTINTPSYHQVSRPLYASAIGRWRHYQHRLAPILPRLQPYVERFGYSAEAG